MIVVPRNSHPTSPCNDDCVIDASSGYCEGCFRSLEEITEWPIMDADEKGRVIDAIDKRRAQNKENK